MTGRETEGLARERERETERGRNRERERESKRERGRTSDATGRDRTGLTDGWTEDVWLISEMFFFWAFRFQGFAPTGSGKLGLVPAAGGV